MAPRSVAMLLTAPNEANGWRTTERPCRQCGAAFQPVRQDQRFCPGGVCRVAYWSEHQSMEIHRCRCGRECAGTPPGRCRRWSCGGVLIREQGEEKCMHCGRRSDVAEMAERGKA